MIFDSEFLLKELRSLTAGISLNRWIVAFSGGMDSTVLLHALANSATDAAIVAVHINHGLQAESESWESHCEQIAADLGVGFVLRKVDVKGIGTNGPEAAARAARYAALNGVVESGDCVLSAHHANDQAETLLLNLMRGSGSAGLAGIGVSQALGEGMLLRPMLDVPRECIASYASMHQLHWLDDPSNAETQFDRNFLRHEIIPALADRWPAVSGRLRRSAELLGETSELLSELADIDLEAAGSPKRLQISSLSILSRPRLRNLLRRAIRLCALPAPPATRLNQIVNELIPARADAQPKVTWTGVEVRRFRDEIFILAAGVRSGNETSVCLSVTDGAQALGGDMGSISLLATDGEGIAPALAKNGLDVRKRLGGEEIRLPGHARPRKLKKLLRDHAILPWMRPQLPLLYAGDTLVAVADMWVDAHCLDAPGYVVKWHDRPVLI